MSSFLADLLASNPYFSAGFGLIGVGAGAQILRKSSQWGLSYLRRKFVVSIELTSKDHSYNWFLYWMSKRVADTQHLSVRTSLMKEGTAMGTGFIFLPSVGNHYFRYQGTWIKAERTREKAVLDARTSSMWECVNLTMLGRDKHLLFKLLEEAKTMAMAEEEGCTVIYTAVGPEWRPFGVPRLRRPFDSVILPGELSEELYKDVVDFLNNSDWYSTRGIPYRRGYLLYGPPGCGKSSFVQALAGRLGYNICIVSLSDTQLSDDRLNHLLVNAPDRTILLLEDIDAAFQQREITSRYQNFITFSGLLNALDGVAAAEGRILFMTTNHLEKLDDALIRPGRVDRLVHLGHASSEMMERMFERFYPEVMDKGLFREVLGDPRVLEGRLSMAHLQGVFLTNKTTPQLALQQIKREIQAIDKKNH
uniref:Mitochondrial chaperone BCS1 n=1 Tax=Arcella intermedia TaxID=1963864 RepID=A0A6B2L512_9EUKA